MRRSIGQEQHSALRRRLDNVTEGVPDAAQLRLVAGLADEHPHSMRLLLAADRERRETWAVNCHTYTFRLRVSEDLPRHVTGQVVPTAADRELLLAAVRG